MWSPPPLHLCCSSTLESRPSLPFHFDAEEMPMLLSSSFLPRRNSIMTLLAFVHHDRPRGLRRFSAITTTDAAAAAATAAADQSPSSKTHFMVDYLVTSFGFSPEKAAEASKRLNRIKSPQQPDSFLRFMKTQGFDETQMRELVSSNPRWLGLDVEKTLKPKLQALQDQGFSGPDLTQLILVNPNVLNLSLHRTVLPKIDLWVGLLGSIDILMKFIRKKQWLLSYSIEKTILPNLTLLRECGISDERISMAVKKHPRIILHKPDSLKALVDRVEDLGIPRNSGMFLWALWTVRRVSKARFKAKLELMTSLGWSESEFLSAFRKAPGFLTVSEKTLQVKMKFLVEEAECKPSYVALHPVLLSHSLEKRLIPRHKILKILKSSGLHGGNYQLYTIMTISEEKFIEKFVRRHKDEVPGLLEGYIACGDRGAAT